MIKNYNFRFLYPILILFLLGFGHTCGKNRDAENHEHADTEMAQKEPNAKPDHTHPPDQQRVGKRGRQAIGRGLGSRERVRGGKKWEPSDMIELTDEEEKAIDLETVKAYFKSLKSHLAALGKVVAHPRKKAIVSYAFPARISEIHFQIGDWVRARQELITLQSEEVGTAKSEYYKALADFELAKVNHDRQKRLFDRGVGSQKDFLAREAEYKVSEANLNAAEKKLHVLGFTEKQVHTIADSHQINPIITLFAPIGGKIIEDNAVLGGMIDQSTEILIILDPHVLVIDADIYEKDIAKIRIGQEVEVSIPAYPNETFMGKTTYISDVLKEDTRTITVRTEVENREYKLKPGMFANIKVFLNHQNDALVLPKDAILDDGEDKIVFIKKANKYYPQLVELGTQEDSKVEILRGLAAGDEVVTKGNFQLKSKLYDEILKKGHIH
jgi:cobalt-zinc-cadmium efflux system membrane fusion protein